MLTTPSSNEVIKCKFCESENLRQTTKWYRQGVASNSDPAKVFLGIMAVFKCLKCREEFLMIDSLTGNLEAWRKYPPLVGQ